MMIHSFIRHVTSHDKKKPKKTPTQTNNHDRTVLFGHLDHEASDPSSPSSEDEDFLHFFAFIGCHFDGFEFLS